MSELEVLEPVSVTHTNVPEVYLIVYPQVMPELKDNYSPPRGAEEQLPEKLTPAISDVELSVWHLAADIGLDITKRMRGTQRYHLINPASPDPTHHESNLRQHAFTTFNGEIYIRSGQSIEDTLYATGHETVHATAHRKVHLYIDEKGWLHIKEKEQGYVKHDTNTGYAMDEATTQLLTLELMAHYWPQTRHLSGRFYSAFTTYAYHVSFFDVLLQHASRETKTPLGHLKKTLYKGLFNGDDEIQNTLRDIYGDQIATEIQRLPLHNIKFLKALKKSRTERVVRAIPEIIKRIVLEGENERIRRSDIEIVQEALPENN